MMKLEKFSMGVGDRFGFEGIAQLRALQKADALGVHIAPVWNKSNREHSIIGTSPDDTRLEADNAVQVCQWHHSYYVDADHIGLANVDRFIGGSNFFTVDVADSIGKPAGAEAVAGFMKALAHFKGKLHIEGVSKPFEITDALLAEIARKYLCAAKEAGRVYRYIAERKGSETFVTEVSVDEANSPQTPVELLFILAALAGEEIPLQTIAPKFTGAFLKGVDYVGNIRQFSREFEDDLAVVRYAIGLFNLPSSLKLSVHSGSDKFSLYPIMHRTIKRVDAGLHLKTAGTTWLEEVIGLAASNGPGLELAKEIYVESFKRYDELCAPYLTVIEIDRNRLPLPRDVESWDAEEYIQALQHNPLSPTFNRHFRQLVHVGYKVAAEMGDRFIGLLRECRSAIEENVTRNIYERHVQPLFLGNGAGPSQSERSQFPAAKQD